MDEKLGADLGAEQREAIQRGELEVSPPRCSHTAPEEVLSPEDPPEEAECRSRAEVWVVLEHSDRGDTHRIPRCSEHEAAADLRHTVVDREPIQEDTHYE